MSSSPLSAEDLFAFIGGRVDAATRQRIAAEIDVDGSFVSLWFQRLALVSEHPFDIAWERLFDVPIALPPRVTRREQILRLANEVGRLARNHEYSRAMQLQRWAHNLAVIELGAEHRETATYLNGLARLQYSTGLFQESLGTYRNVLDIRERVMGVNHTDTAITLAGLGRVYEALGNYPEAVAMHRRALLICEATLGPDHPDTAVSCNDLGCALQAIGQLDEALQYHERALEINRKFDGEESRNVAIGLGNIGCTQESLGRNEEARGNHEQGVSILESLVGEWHQDTAWALTNLGSTLLSLRSLDSAEATLNRCLQILEAHGRLQSLEAAFCWNELGVAQHLAGNWPAAAESLLKAVEIYDAVWGQEHPATKAARHNLWRIGQTLAGSAVELQLDEQFALLRDLIGEAALGTKIEHGVASWSVPFEGRSLSLSVVLAA